MGVKEILQKKLELYLKLSNQKNSILSLSKLCNSLILLSVTLRVLYFYIVLCNQGLSLA